MLNQVKEIVPNIELSQYDLEFYGKEVRHRLKNVPNLIFLRKNEFTKKELKNMDIEERKIIVHEFEFYKDKHKIEESTYLVFLKSIFGHKTESYFDWIFATNIEDLDQEKIIGKFKVR